MTLEGIKHIKQEKPLAEEFKKGEVEWNTQGKTTGEVKRSSPHPDIKGHHVAASEDNPEYLVESDKTGKKLLPDASRLRSNA